MKILIFIVIAIFIIGYMALGIFISKKNDEMCECMDKINAERTKYDYIKIGDKYCTMFPYNDIDNNMIYGDIKDVIEIIDKIWDNDKNIGYCKYKYIKQDGHLVTNPMFMFPYKSDIDNILSTYTKHLS